MVHLALLPPPRSCLYCLLPAVLVEEVMVVGVDGRGGRASVKELAVVLARGFEIICRWPMPVVSAVLHLRALVVASLQALAGGARPPFEHLRAIASAPLIDPEEPISLRHRWRSWWRCGHAEPRREEAAIRRGCTALGGKVLLSPVEDALKSGGVHFECTCLQLSQDLWLGGGKVVPLFGICGWERQDGKVGVMLSGCVGTGSAQAGKHAFGGDKYASVPSMRL